jgi:diguanylate cyclase (GGDEF)-like protein/PAS domain S-box-containing protein
MAKFLAHSSCYKRLLLRPILLCSTLLTISFAFAQTTDLQLSNEEKAWLQAHPQIRLAVDIAWPPFEYIDENRNYVGMAAEYIDLVAEKLGIEFVVEKEKPWSEMVEAVKNHELDMYSSVLETAQRREYVNFTRPYLSFPMVIVTSDKVTYVDGIRDLKNESVAVVKGYATQDLLEQNHPELDLYRFENLTEALQAVSLGKVFAYIGNIASVSETLKREGLTNLKVSGQTPYKFDLSMAVRKDWPQMMPILQKALDSITPGQHDEIYQNWIKLRYEYEADYSFIWKVLLGVGVGVVLILIWNRRLRHEVTRRTEAENKLQLAHQRLELGLRGGDLGLWDWNIRTNAIQINERWLTMLGLPADRSEIDFDFWSGLLHEDDRSAVKTSVERLLNRDVELYDEEFRLLSTSGDYRWIRSRGQIVEFKDNGEPIRVAGVHQDITELKKARVELEQAHKQLMKYVQIVDEYVITSSTDDKGLITYASEAFCKISGYAQEELIGHSHSLLRHEDMPDALYKDLWSTIKRGHTWEGEIKNRKKNGDYYWVHAYISPVFDLQKNIEGFTAIRQDITDKKLAEKLSMTDELTSLYNRRYFNLVFPQELARAEREKKSIALLLIDVDYFKPYNDNYGHLQGDSALKAIGQVFKAILRRAGDFAFRIGGEEFGAIITFDEIRVAINLAERIRREVEDLKLEHDYSSASPYVTVSIGMKIHQCSGERPPEMTRFYKIADRALYQAKETGRNQVRII